jgi:hypothetical protein
MQHRKRILSHVRSNLVAYIALFFALSGSAYAAGGLLISSNNIVDGQVFSADVADEDLTGIDIQNGGLTGADVANGTLTGLDVADGGLAGVDIANGSVTGADVAVNSLTGANVADGFLTGADVADNSLSGADIAEDTLSVAGMGCQSGKVLGFARVNGIALTRDNIESWTSDPKYVDIANNCTGGPVLVRGTGGFYGVKFVGNPAALAVATNTNDLAATNDDNILSVSKQYSAVDGWFFGVTVQDVCGTGDTAGQACRVDGTVYQSGDFTILLP